jgi:hypothetical protein
MRNAYILEFEKGKSMCIRWDCDNRYAKVLVAAVNGHVQAPANSELEADCYRLLELIGDLSVRLETTGQFWQVRAVDE